MKITLLLACASCLLATSSFVESAAITAPLEIISYDDISHSDRQHIESLSEQLRKKRSGSPDFFTPIKTKIVSGLKNHIGLIAHGSAAVAGHLVSKAIASSSSSASKHYGGHGGYEHHYEPHYHEEKGLDIWSLKKGILSTLLQAAKAIKGGVLAVKGQLIKGGGQLISAKGRLISGKGELLTKLGKHIASSALHPPKPHEEEVYEYVKPVSSYGVPHSSYGSPSHSYGPSHHQSLPHNEYLPQKYHSAYEAPHKSTNHGSDTGVIILKKIPKGHSSSSLHDHSYPSSLSDHSFPSNFDHHSIGYPHTSSHEQISDFKPESDYSHSSFGALVPLAKSVATKLFNSATSLAAHASKAAFKASAAGVAAGAGAASSSLYASASGHGSHHSSKGNSFDILSSLYAATSGHGHDSSNDDDTYPPKADHNLSNLDHNLDYGSPNFDYNKEPNSYSESSGYNYDTPIHRDGPIQQTNLKDIGAGLSVKDNEISSIQNSNQNIFNILKATEYKDHATVGFDNQALFQSFAQGNNDNIHFSITPQSNTNPQLFLGMNLPLDNSDIQGLKNHNILNEKFPPYGPSNPDPNTSKQHDANPQTNSHNNLPTLSHDLPLLPNNFPTLDQTDVFTNGPQDLNTFDSTGLFSHNVPSSVLDPRAAAIKSPAFKFLPTPLTNVNSPSVLSAPTKVSVSSHSTNSVHPVYTHPIYSANAPQIHSAGRNLPTSNSFQSVSILDPSESFKSDKILAPSLSLPSKKMPAPFKKLSKKPNIDVVRSITYELGPNGPIKI